MHSGYMHSAEVKKEDVMEDILEIIEFYLNKRAAGRLQIACIVYSNTYGLLGMTAKAEELLRRLLWFILSEQEAEHRIPDRKKHCLRRVNYILDRFS